MENVIKSIRAYENQRVADDLKLAVINHYKPIIYEREFKMSEVQKLKSQGFLIPNKDNQIILPAGAISDLETTILVTAVIEQNINCEPLFLQSGNEEDKKVVIKFSYAINDKPNSILDAFYKDIILTLTDFNSMNEYTSQGTPTLLYEMSSTIEELPKPIAEVLAPKWCDYFTDYYHAEGILNYCR